MTADRPHFREQIPEVERVPAYPSVVPLGGLALCSFWGVGTLLPDVLQWAGVAGSIPPIVQVALIHLLGIGGVLGLAVLWSDLPVRELFALRRFSPGVLWAVGVGMVGTSILGSEAANWLVRWGALGELSRGSSSGAALPEAGWLTLLVVAGIVPWTEELLFRGLILDGLRVRGPAWSSILICALLFALFHLDPLQMPLAFVAGITLAIVRVQSQSILPCVIGHAVLNSTPYLLTWTLGEIPGYGFEETASPVQTPGFNLLGLSLFLVGGIGLACRRAFARTNWSA